MRGNMKSFERDLQQTDTLLRTLLQELKQATERADGQAHELQKVSEEERDAKDHLIMLLGSSGQSTGSSTPNGGALPAASGLQTMASGVTSPGISPAPSPVMSPAPGGSVVPPSASVVPVPVAVPAPAPAPAPAPRPIVVPVGPVVTVASSSGSGAGGMVSTSVREPGVLSPRGGTAGLSGVGALAPSPLVPAGRPVSGAVAGAAPQPVAGGAAGAVFTRSALALRGPSGGAAGAGGRR